MSDLLMTMLLIGSGILLALLAVIAISTYRMIRARFSAQEHAIQQQPPSVLPRQNKGASQRYMETQG